MFVLPPQLLIAALLLELSTLVQAWYWAQRGYALVRPAAIIPLTASTFALIMFYVVIDLELPASIPVLQVISRVLLLITSLATTHMLVGYWGLTWGAWRDRR